MMPTTIDVIKAGLKSDPSLTPADRARLMAVLRNGLTPQKPDCPSSDNPPRLLRRGEVANRLARSLRFVDKLAASGILTKRKLPGCVRAAGFLASDVDALIQGGGVQ